MIGAMAIVFLRLPALCDRAWRVFRASPLMDFDHDPAFLSAWRETLDLDLERLQRSDKAKLKAKVSLWETLVFVCLKLCPLCIQVETLPGLRAAQTDALAVRITVRAELANGARRRQEEEESVVRPVQKSLVIVSAI